MTQKELDASPPLRHGDSVNRNKSTNHSQGVKRAETQITLCMKGSKPIDAVENSSGKERLTASETEAQISVLSGSNRGRFGTQLA